MKIVENTFKHRHKLHTHILLDDGGRIILAGDFEQVTRVMNYIMEIAHENCI